MQTLRYFAIGGFSFVAAISFGFLGALIPSIAAIHWVVIVLLLFLVALVAINQLGRVQYYQRQQIGFTYSLLAVMTVIAYLGVMAFGAWLHNPIDCNKPIGNNEIKYCENQGG